MAKELNKKHKTWIIDQLTKHLLNQELFSCKNPNDHINVKAVEIKPMSLEVAFMLTNCYFVKIIFKVSSYGIQCEHSEEEKEFDLVVKFGPDVDPELYKAFNMVGLFSKEIITYESIVPLIKCLANSPKCYYSHNKFMDAVIVLSDFSKDGWKMSQSRVNLSLDHILVAVKHLGEFHGCMYALKLANADTFNSMKIKLMNAEYGKDSRSTTEWFLCQELGIRRATACVRASKNAQNIVPESFLKHLEEILYGAEDYRRRIFQPIEPMAVICHGDYLRNNIAFRYNDDGEAIDAMMFDFQTMSYASPMIDLCTFMANSTGHEVRDKHFSDIFTTYHESVITQFLATSKWKENDIPDFLKFDSLLKEYARYIPFGLAIATTFLQDLHDPFITDVSSQISLEETIKNIFDRGGDVVNEELCALIVHIYNLYEQLNLTLEKV